MNVSLALNYLSFYRPVSYMPSGMRGQATASAQPAVSGQDAVPGETSAPGQTGRKASPSPAAADNQRVFGQPDYDTYECQTCKNRKYQDGSDDLGVSFKTPTRLTPEQAAYAVRAHESEHVARAWATAQREDKEIVSQSVTYRTGVCPECGKTYIAGGTTQTVFRSAPETYDKEPAKKGQYIDLLA